MKKILGIVMVIVGGAIGLYVGIWVCFVGGIIDVIQQIRAENFAATAAAWGVGKVVMAGLFGWLSAAVLAIPGFFMIKNS